MLSTLQTEAQENSDWNFFDFDKLIEKLHGWGESLILKLPNFVIAILVFAIFWFLAKYVSKFVRQILMRGVKQDSIRVMAGKTAFAITVLIGFFVALGIMDLDKVLTSVLAGAGVVGLAIGLALQGTLNNTFSGVILSFMPRLQLGDWVETNDYSGFVEDITLRNVTLRQSDNNYVIVPNSSIVDSPFKNWSQTARSRVFVNCGVGYESDLEAVKKLTIETLSAKFEQQGSEEIEFFYESFGDSSINFVARFWAPVTKRKDMLAAQDLAIIAIKKAFDANDINIPFPIRTLDFGKNKFRSETITIANSGGGEAVS
ncbi:mechanosensitive ion channel family protein [Leeuwenhoekiella parthenopeia]|uniref:Mechanosensitive ion channel family protein n=1 Tax=Leeuwenhoekiella parthenopeia TaxID=2890320 RepID=A0ABS8GRG4_9FLAO|nr:mechanosensitive ion channel family protein [Leeuwenhoekiella parthenopeia]MCC4211178.1 mechanosensitive ion channel family protein [Leeuwenhoekiella parthenopeia]